MVDAEDVLEGYVERTTWTSVSEKPATPHHAAAVPCERTASPPASRTPTSAR
jgi:hypothetical protein